MPTPEDKPTTPEPVTLPDWFEQYRELIAETGGNEIEDLLTDLRDQKGILRTNMPRGVLAFMAHAQVGLLHRLHRANLLLPVPPGVQDTHINAVGAKHALCGFIGGEDPGALDKVTCPECRSLYISRQPLGDVRDEGPTPQQEIDWAIHNDHADG